MKRSLPNWARWLTRLAVWGSTLALAIVLWLLNVIYSAAPHAYENIHQLERWTPLAHLTPEARAFSRSYWNHVRHATIVRANDFSAYVVLYFTLEPEVGLEIALNRCTTLQSQKEVDLETLLLHTYGRADSKEVHLRRLCEQSELDPITYLRLVQSLETEPLRTYPGRPTYY